MLFLANFSFGQLTADFTVSDDTLCLDEELALVNESTGAIFSEWDFCVGDLASDPIATSLLSDAAFDSPFHVKFLKVGASAYAFIPSFSNSKLFRVDLSEGNTIHDLGDFGSLLNGAFDVDIIQNDFGDYFGFIANRTNDNVIRLSFGSSVENTPTADAISVTGLIDPDGIKVERDSDGFKVIVLALGEVFILDFGNDLNAVPTESSFGIPGGDRLWGASFLHDEGSIFALVTDFDDREIHHLDFEGDVIDSTPVISDLVTGGLLSASPGAIEFVRDGPSIYALLVLRSAGLVRYLFDSATDLSPAGAALGRFGVLGNAVSGFSMQLDSSVWRGIASDFGANTIYNLTFLNDCNATIAYSAEDEPTGVSYDVPGDYIIGLSATNGIANSNHYDTLTVTTAVAPSISFGVSDSRCVATPLTFTSIDDGDISSYSWDFNEDGLEDSNAPNPTYDYSADGPGIYTVHLEVTSALGCTSSYSQTLTISTPPSSADFEIASGPYCSNAELTFTNLTDSSGLEEVISYLWDFNGEGISTSRNPDFTFETSGEKTIGLEAIIPGCTTSVYSEVITVIDGPEVGFSYTSNCFGEAISFNNESIGGTSNFWDFGDGSALVMDSSTPSHIYTDAGTYTVRLSVSNESGCETIFSEDIEVTDALLVDYATGDAIENLPISFEGIDNSLADDDVLSWQWDFAGLGNSTDQVTSYTFENPGSFDVSLTVTTVQGCESKVLKTVEVVESKVATADFGVLASACVQQELALENRSLNGESYAWDFCPNDLLYGAVIDTLPTSAGLFQPFDLKWVNAGLQWHSFVINFESSELYRYDFGPDPSSVPIETNLGNPGSLLDGPIGLTIVQEGLNWYILVVNRGNGEVIKISFGDSLTSTPISESLTDFGTINSPDGIEAVWDGIRYVAVLTDGNALRILDFGSSMLNVPSIESQIVTDGSRLWDISLLESNGNWFGLLTSFSNRKVFMVDFQTTIEPGAIVAELNFDEDLTSSPADNELLFDGERYYGFFLQRSGEMTRLDFGLELSVFPTSTSLGNLGGLAGESSGLSIVRHKSSWFGLSSNFFENELYRLEFKENCNSTVDYSEQFVPSFHNYSESDDYTILLEVTHRSGAKSFKSEVISVANELAPAIDFSFSSVCISSPNIFSPSSTSLSSYSWDFNNDGIEDSNLESPHVAFDTLGGPGIYTIRLDVNDGTCSNFVEQEITIYPEPPTPTVSPSAVSQCINEEISISNTTDESQHPGVLSYQWDFDNDGVVDSSEPEPSFSFSEPGLKTVSVFTEIPGCTSTTTTFEVTILEGPTSNFTATTVCDGEAVSFSNSSENATLYNWDFTDGITSTTENPDHIFPAPGSYFVALTAIDENGCEDVEIREVVVQDVPDVLFDFGIVCTSSQGNLFEDQSTVNNSDIISWSWRVDGTEVSTEQNPLLQFAAQGTPTIQLAVTSANGCESSFTEDIDVLAAPSPDFTSIVGCVGEVSTFADISQVEGSEIESWIWDVNGTSYLTENVEHIFESPGQYEVTLEVSAQNFCSESITRTIEVLQLPDVDFAVAGDCNNEVVNATANLTIFNDPVTSQQWRLNEAVIGNGSEILINSLDAGTYDLELMVETANGCSASTVRSITINTSPEARFEATKLYGVPDERISIANESIGASSFVWQQDGETVQESQEIAPISFSDPGNYLVSLIASNELGCADTIQQEFMIRVPEVDLRITNFDIIEEDNVGRVLVEIGNQSNLPIDTTTVQITLENQFSVTEEINLFIDAGSSQLVELNTRIPLQLSEPSYFCVQVGSQYVAYPDLTPLDNESCINIEPAIVVEDPFPNPVVDQARLRIVTPSAGLTLVKVISSSGKLEVSKKLTAISGLNTYFVDLSTLHTGIYVLSVEVNGQVFQKKLLKL